MRLLEKCNAMYKKEKNGGFYTINNNTVTKINDFEDDITIGHELDLIKMFGEVTTQTIEKDRAAHNNN